MGRKECICLAHSDPSPSLRELKAGDWEAGTAMQETAAEAGRKAAYRLAPRNWLLYHFYTGTPTQGWAPHSLCLPHQSLIKKALHRCAHRQSNKGGSSKEISSFQLTGCVNLPKTSRVIMIGLKERVRMYAKSTLKARSSNTGN